MVNGAKRKNLRCAALLLAAGIFVVSGVRGNPEGRNYPVYMKFVNSRTGVAAKVHGIRVEGLEKVLETDETGIVKLDLPEGSHKVSIENGEYAAFEMDLRVEGELTPVQEVELDPVGEESPEPVEADMAVVAGTVVDRDSAGALTGVRIGTENEDGPTTVSGQQGEFRVEVSVPAVKEGEVPVTTLRFEREGYVTEIYRNLILSAGDARRMVVSLDRMTTGGVTTRENDEIRERLGRRVYHWVFDATVE